MKKLILLLAWGLVAAAPLAARWRSVQSDTVLLFYPQGQEARAGELLAMLEERRPQVEALIGQRVGRPVLVLEDYGTVANGYADPVFMSIHLGLSPPVSGGLSTGRSWYALVGVHEYAHLLQLTAAGGFPGLLTALFGNILSPNLFVPLWWAEGVAVYSESVFDPYSGRLNGGFYDARLAARVREGRFPSLAEATFQPASYPGGEAPYLYGGMFVQYLMETYGPDSLARFTAGTGASTLFYLSPLLPALGADRQACRVFGRSIPRLWEDWQSSEEQRLGGRDQIGNRVSRPGWSTDWPLADRGRLYYTRAYPVKSGAFRSRWRYELVEQVPATGEEKVLVRSTAPFISRFRIAGDTLYYALAELEPGYANTWFEGYGYSARLYALNLKSGRQRRLLKGPLRTFVVTGPGDILYTRDRTDAFGSELWRLAGGRAERLAASGYLVGELAAGDKEIFLTARREGENFSIYALSRQALEAVGAGAGSVPDKANAASEARLSNEANLASLARPLVESDFQEFALSAAGERLLFSANYRGQLDSYILDTVSGALFRLTGGTAGAAALDGETLYFVGAGSEGTGIYRRPAQPVAAQVPPPLADARAPVRPGAFPPPGCRPGSWLPNLSTLRPRVLYPIFSGTAGGGRVTLESAGAGIMGLSALGDIAYTLESWYVPQSEAVELDLAVSFLLPALLSLSLGLSTDGENELEAALEAPLFRSLGPGLTSLKVGLAGRLLEEDFSRLRLAPFAGADWLAPRGAASLRLETVLERRGLGSDRDLSGLQGRLSVSRQLRRAEAAAGLLGVWALEGVSWELPAPRGYTENPVVDRGGLLSLDLSLPLLRIRRGFWNPSVYLEDLFVVPFFDLVFTEAGTAEYAGGAELHLEIKLSNMLGGLPLDAYAGAALTREQELGVYFGMKSPLLPLRVGEAAGETSLPARPVSERL